MGVDIFSLLYGIAQWAVQFFADSFLVAAVKFFLFVYVAVLFVDIVMLFMLHGVSSDLKKTLFGSERPLISRSAMINRWEKILARLKSSNPSQYKVAILEADALANEILSGIGYRGATMAEKFEHVKEGHLETRSLLMEAHQIRNRVVHEIDFALSRADAQKWLDAYRKFFDEVELF